MKSKILEPKNLPYFGAIVQAVLFALAGNEFFPTLGWLVGAGVGSVVNYSIALASSRISDIAEKRKAMARLALIGMFLLSPTTITLSFFAPHTIYASIAWSICVDLSIILAGSIAGKSLIPEAKPKRETETRSAARSDRSAKVSDRSKSLSKPVAKIACRYAPQCDRSFTTQNAENAHAGKCGFKPTISMPVDQKVEKPS